MYASYCGAGNVESHTSGSGFNERSFPIVDVDNSYGGTFDPLITANPAPGENLVGSFVIRAGSLTTTLARMWVSNTGSAQEGTDIPNDGVRMYYEAAQANGSERYNGTESFVSLYGDYAGNSTANQEWGSDVVNVAIPVGNGLRVYIVISSLSANFNLTRTVNFQIINDGISLTPAQNTSYTLLRVNPTLLNTASVPALPVRWLDFDGALMPGGAVALHWSTATERDNALFRVQRSADGRAWAEIGQVPGRGTQSGIQQYSFTDAAPLPGMSYYRLAQVDFDGATSHSAIVSVKNESAASDIAVYPNPLHGDVLTVRWPATLAPGHVRVFDAAGRVVKTWAVPDGAPQTWSIPAADLPAGICWLQVGRAAPVRVVR